MDGDNKDAPYVKTSCHLIFVYCLPAQACAVCKGVYIGSCHVKRNCSRFLTPQHASPFTGVYIGSCHVKRNCSNTVPHSHMGRTRGRRARLWRVRADVTRIRRENGQRWVAAAGGRHGAAGTGGHSMRPLPGMDVGRCSYVPTVMNTPESAKACGCGVLASISQGWCSRECACGSGCVLVHASTEV